MTVVRLSLLLAASLALSCAAPPPAPGGGRDPTGPPQLAALDRLAGRWEATWETTLATGEHLAGRSRTEARWTANGRVLLEETTKELQTFGRSDDLGLWCWDGSSGTYLYWRFNSAGARETGTLRYEPDEDTFYLASETVEADGRTTRGAGTMRFVDADTKEYRWVTLEAGRDVPLYEVRGTSRRRPR